MKQFFILSMLLAAIHFANAQFVKSYQIQPQQSLTFNCISKSFANTYYIAGIVDTSVYIAEVDQSGNKLREKLIGVGNKAYNLASMITDADGNIVIVGSIKQALTNSKAFLMKISPVLSLLLHKTYDNLNQKGSVALFTQVNDYRAGNALDGYYISGATRNNNNNTASDALLLTVDRNSGVITKLYSGSRGEDNYDAFVFHPGTTQPPALDIFATGRLSTGGTSTFRPWINQHNSNLSFSGNGAHYLQPTNKTARLYSSSLIIENVFSGNPNLTYCWHGDLNATGFGINIGMGSYNASPLTPPIWQWEYQVAPAAARYKLLNQVAADANGYVAEGNWWDGFTTSTDGAIAGEMFLLRTDKGGAPLWSRRLNQVFVNQRSHNSGMLIDKFNGNDMIYAVGFKKINNVTRGILVQIPITGKMDTACAPVQTITPIVRDYSVSDSISTLKLAMADSIHYYPIDCVTTKDSVTCDNPCIRPVLQSADFQLAGVIPIGNTTTFQVTASLFNTGQNSRWIVSEVDPVTGNDITSPNTVQTSLPSGTSGSVWGAATPTSFGNYYSPVGTESSGFGTFLQLHKYRFRHLVSAADNCGIIYSDSVTKSIYMCTGCRTKGVFTVETESMKSGASTKSSSGFTVDNTPSKSIAYPNPANGSITFTLSALQANNPVLQILNAGGQIMKTVKVNSGVNVNIATSSWASGAYVYQVIAGGSIINKGNFAVLH